MTVRLEMTKIERGEVKNGEVVVEIVLRGTMYILDLREFHLGPVTIQQGE